MYNRYIPNGAAYARILEEDAPPFPAPESAPQAKSTPQRERAAQAAPSPPPDPPEGEPALPEEKKTGLAGLLKGLKLEDLDTGDILLLLIVLFLFLEGDDIELIITLGLLLILGL